MSENKTVATTDHFKDTYSIRANWGWNTDAQPIYLILIVGVLLSVLMNTIRWYEDHPGQQNEAKLAEIEACASAGLADPAWFMTWGGPKHLPPQYRFFCVNSQKNFQQQVDPPACNLKPGEPLKGCKPEE